MAKPLFLMPQGQAPFCAQVSGPSQSRFLSFLRLGAAPAPVPTQTHTARPGRILCQGNFCRCFLSAPQDVTLGISATGEWKLELHWWLNPCPQSPPFPTPPLKWDLLCSGHISAPLT